MKKHKHEVVFLRWLDSASTEGWTRAPTENTGLIAIESVGILIHEDKQHVEIVQSKSEINHCGAIMAIPKSVILKRQTIKEIYSEFGE